MRNSKDWPLLYSFFQAKIIQCVLYNATADKWETKTRQYIQINKCPLRGWLKVKKRGVLSRQFIAPIGNYT